MRFLMAFLILLGSYSAIAEEVSRETAAAVIDEMVRTNSISIEEAQKAKARIQMMTQLEWKKLNDDANEKANRMMASVPEEQTNEDIDQEQFHAIQSDLAVIAPY